MFLRTPNSRRLWATDMVTATTVANVATKGA
jgi:hypothetical protein